MSLRCACCFKVVKIRRWCCERADSRVYSLFSYQRLLLFFAANIHHGSLCFLARITPNQSCLFSLNIRAWELKIIKRYITAVVMFWSALIPFWQMCIGAPTWCLWLFNALVLLVERQPARLSSSWPILPGQNAWNTANRFGCFSCAAYIYQQDCGESFYILIPQ